MIKIENLSKIYGDKKVLHIEDLIINNGESIGLVGNNGAGKTTLFSLLLDLIQPSSGRIISKDIIVSESEAWKPFTTSFIDESFLIGYLTPEEYFYFIGELRDQNKADIDAFLADFEEFFNDEILNQKKYLRDLSKGNQKKVGIIAALIGKPEIIILDEPFANLDPTTQFRLKKILKNQVEKHKITLLVSSHDLTHVTEVSDRIIVLEKGEIKIDTPKTEKTLQDLYHYFEDEE